MKDYYYLSGQEVIRIRAKRQPGENTRPYRGTWTVNVFYDNTKTWGIAPFPEITWRMLSGLVYIGSVGVMEDEDEEEKFK